MALLSLVIVASFCGAAWLLACERLEAGLEQAVLDAKDQGWIITHGKASWSGFPLAAELDVAAFAVAPDPAVFVSGPSWSAGRLRIRLAVTRPTTLALRPEGTQRVALGRVSAIPVQARAIELLVPLRGGPVTGAATQLSASLPIGTVMVGAAKLTSAQGWVTAELTNVVLPKGPPIERLQGRGSLTRPFPPAATAAESARGWRDAGGALELAGLSLNWGPLAATGQATLGLDQQLQPEGDGTFQVTGLAPTLDALAKTGALPPGAALAAKAVFALLAAPAQGGPVALPVRIHDGVLVVARFPVLRLPQLLWD